jgi:hypothetical protein
MNNDDPGPKPTRPVFTKAERAGFNDGNLMFEVKMADGQLIQFEITPDCFMQFFAMGWKAAAAFPPAAARGEAFALQAAGAFAIVKNQPSLLLQSGPLAMSLAFLIDDIQKFRPDFGGRTHQQSTKARSILSGSGTVCSERMGNHFGPNGFSIGSSRHVSSSK